MNTLLLSLLSLAIILFIAAFFKKDRVTKLEEDLEQLTLTHMQDIYLLKKKIKILEEEFLSDDLPMSPLPALKQKKQQAPINEILKNQVLSLYQQGLSLKQISAQSTLSTEVITKIIEESLRGSTYE